MRPVTYNKEMEGHAALSEQMIYHNRKLDKHLLVRGVHPDDGALYTCVEWNINEGDFAEGWPEVLICCEATELFPVMELPQCDF